MRDNSRTESSIALSIPMPWISRLEEQAAKTSVSLADLVRDIIHDHLSHEIGDVGSPFLALMGFAAAVPFPISLKLVQSSRTRYLWANDCFLRSVGLVFEDIVNKTPAQLWRFDKKQVARICKVDKSILRTGQPSLSIVEQGSNEVIRYSAELSFPIGSHKLPNVFLATIEIGFKDIAAVNYFCRSVVPESAWLFQKEKIRLPQTILPPPFHSCFISYSTKDERFVDSLMNDLQNAGVRCWLAPKDLKVGDYFRQRIAEAIRSHDRFLLILSKHSVESDWVREEVETCFERESHEECAVLFPIRIDNAVMVTKQDWAASIRRQRHIADFCGRRGSASYGRALERLLGDLKSAIESR